MLVEQRLEAKKAPVRQGAKVPHDFDRHLGVAIFDSSHIREIVILLRGIVMQPPDDLDRPGCLDVDGSIAPDHIDALYRPREALA